MFIMLIIRLSSFYHDCGLKAFEAHHIRNTVTYLEMVRITHSFCYSFTLIITSSGAYWIDMSPVILILGMDFWIYKNEQINVTNEKHSQYDDTEHVQNDYKAFKMPSI